MQALILGRDRGMQPPQLQVILRDSGSSGGPSVNAQLLAAGLARVKLPSQVRDGFHAVRPEIYALWHDEICMHMPGCTCFYETAPPHVAQVSLLAAGLSRMTMLRNVPSDGS